MTTPGIFIDDSPRSIEVLVSDREDVKQLFERYHDLVLRGASERDRQALLAHIDALIARNDELDAAANDGAMESGAAAPFLEIAH